MPSDRGDIRHGHSRLVKRRIGLHCFNISFKSQSSKMHIFRRNPTSQRATLLLPLVGQTFPFTKFFSLTPHCCLNQMDNGKASSIAWDSVDVLHCIGRHLSTSLEPSLQKGEASKFISSTIKMLPPCRVDCFKVPKTFSHCSLVLAFARAIIIVLLSSFIVPAQLSRQFSAKCLVQQESAKGSSLCDTLRVKALLRVPSSASLIHTSHPGKSLSRFTLR